MEFSRPEYWSGWPFPSPGDLPNPGIELVLLSQQEECKITEGRMNYRIKGGMEFLPKIQNNSKSFTLHSKTSLCSLKLNVHRGPGLSFHSIKVVKSTLSVRQNYALSVWNFFHHFCLVQVITLEVSLATRNFLVTDATYYHQN